jgi:hypothetical protein
LLDDDRRAAQQPVLPATLEGRPESLLLRAHDRTTGRDGVARVAGAAQLRTGPPLWIGTTQRLHYARPLKFVGIWRPVADDDSAHVRVRADLMRRELTGTSTGMATLEAPHPESSQPCCAVREH